MARVSEVRQGPLVGPPPAGVRSTHDDTTPRPSGPSLPYPPALPRRTAGGPGRRGRPPGAALRPEAPSPPQDPVSRPRPDPTPTSGSAEQSPSGAPARYHPQTAPVPIRTPPQSLQAPALLRANPLALHGGTTTRRGPPPIPTIPLCSNSAVAAPSGPPRVPHVPGPRKGAWSSPPKGTEGCLGAHSTSKRQQHSAKTRAGQPPK